MLRTKNVCRAPHTEKKNEDVEKILVAFDARAYFQLEKRHAKVDERLVF